MTQAIHASAGAIAAAQQRFLSLFAANDVPGIGACYTEDAQMAVEVGTYTRKRGDGSTFDHGKYMVVWKRVSDAWLIHRDMFSTSLAKTPALS